MAKDPEDGKADPEGEEGQGQQGEGETTTAGKSS